MRWHLIASGLALVPTVLAVAATPAAEPEFAAQRKLMVEAVAEMARDTSRTTGRARFADGVMNALGTVPRHAFVPRSQAAFAYENRPLPIGNGQTISQPYIVALSTDLIEPKLNDVVLEIGTGSGYQAAVLAMLVAKVYSIEIVEPLGREAAARLQALGYSNVEVRIGDGYQGWAEAGPFDGIVVTAAAPFVPEPLVQQLKHGGRMVIPVDSGFGGQELLLLTRNADGTVTRRVILPVRFVPMTGKGVAGRR